MLQEIGAFAFFLLFTIVLTWPVAARLDTSVAYLGDPLLNTWILDWDLHSSPARRRISTTPTFSIPANIRWRTARTSSASPSSSFPFYLLGFTPLAIYNIALLLGYAFSGYGAFVLGRR